MKRICLTQAERESYKNLLDTLPLSNTEYNKWGSTKDTLITARRLYCQAKPFFITGSVNSPYSGCSHEPQIWLVTPAGCEMQEDLQNKTSTSAIVWPLYASGQGVLVNTISDVVDLFEWLDKGNLPDGYTSGAFDSFEVHPWGPISEFPPREHYWAHAVKIGQSQYGIDIPWKCDKCDRTQEGTEGGDPHFTGYRGNGGIGVFMEGALCDDCFDAGVCRVCEQHSSYEDQYDDDVAEHGLLLCGCHSEEILRAAKLTLTGEAEAVINALPNDSLLEFRPKLRNAGQTFLPNVEAKPDWRVGLFMPDGREISGVSLDYTVLSDELKSHDIDFDAAYKVVHDRRASCIEEGEFSYNCALTVLVKHIEEAAEVEEAA